MSAVSRPREGVVPRDRVCRHMTRYLEARELVPSPRECLRRGGPPRCVERLKIRARRTPT